MTAVRFMHNEMVGAPTVSTNNGDLTALLDACLVNGFNVRSVVGITRTDTTATVTLAAGHGYEVDQIVRIAGADQSEYNGDHRVLVATATTITFAVAGSPATPATTSTAIQIRTAPLGFEIAFTGTNKRAYRSPNVLSNRLFLRVDDSLDPLWNAAYSKFGKVTLCEGLTGIDDFVGRQAPFRADIPLANHVATGSGTTAIGGWYKWYYAHGSPFNGFESSSPTGGSRSWTIVGTDRGFYLFIEWRPGRGRCLYSFMDFTSYRPNDPYATLLTATDYYQPANSTAFNNLGSDFPVDQFTYGTRTGESTGKVLLTNFTMTGPTTVAYYTTISASSSGVIAGVNGGIPWPNGPDYGLIIHPLYLHESGGHLRGVMPGIYYPINNAPPILHRERVVGVTGYEGRKFLTVACHRAINGNAINDARILFDITGPWY